MMTANKNVLFDSKTTRKTHAQLVDFLQNSNTQNEQAQKVPKIVFNKSV